MLESSVPSKVEEQYNYPMSWVYIIKNKGNKIYVGVSDNPNSRLQYHNRRHGAQFTQNNPSFEIAFLEKYPDLSAARKREIQIKKWRREKKDNLIERYKNRLNTKI